MSDDPFLCPRPAGPDYYPAPDKQPKDLLAAGHAGESVWKDDYVILSLSARPETRRPGAQIQYKPYLPADKPKGRPFASVRAILQHYKDTK